VNSPYKGNIGAQDFAAAPTYSLSKSAARNALCQEFQGTVFMIFFLSVLFMVAMAMICEMALHRVVVAKCPWCPGIPSVIIRENMPLVGICSIIDDKQASKRASKQHLPHGYRSTRSVDLFVSGLPCSFIPSFLPASLSCVLVSFQPSELWHQVNFSTLELRV